MCTYIPHPQWSFGVVLWELMTRGVKPYADIDNVDLRRFLELGRRLEKPAVTPQCMSVWSVTFP